MKEYKDVFTKEFWDSVREDDELAYWQQKAKIDPYDSIRQYKWPEEKPEPEQFCLVKTSTRFVVAQYTKQWPEREGSDYRFWVQDLNYDFFDYVGNVEYWWDLPQVRE